MPHNDKQYLRFSQELLILTCCTKDFTVLPTLYMYMGMAHAPAGLAGLWEHARRATLNHIHMTYDMIRLCMMRRIVASVYNCLVDFTGVRVAVALCW